MKQYTLPENGFSTKEERESFWREVITEQRKGKLTQKKFCELNGLKISSFKSWVRKINQELISKQPSFVQVEVKAEAKETVAKVVGGLEIKLLTGEIIKLSGMPLSDLLRTAIMALRNVSC